MLKLTLLFLAILVTSCGGGGGGGSSSTVTVTVPSSAIVISEVSSCFYTDIDCWFEIYNRSGATVNLGNYSIKSTSVSVLGGTLSSSTFSLPSLNIPAYSYAVISSNPNNSEQRNVQKIFYA